tara:strand:+ start:289 stop:471 length:183 start_codon:yes stop_codon:yes gene_type:complete
MNDFDDDDIGNDIDEVFALHHIVERQAVHMKLLAKALRFYADGGSDGGNKARSVFKRLEK